MKQATDRHISDYSNTAMRRLIILTQI